MCFCTLLKQQYYHRRYISLTPSMPSPSFCSCVLHRWDRAGRVQGGRASGHTAILRPRGQQQQEEEAAGHAQAEVSGHQQHRLHPLQPGRAPPQVLHRPLRPAGALVLLLYRPTAAQSTASWQRLLQRPLRHQPKRLSERQHPAHHTWGASQLYGDVWR